MALLLSVLPAIANPPRIAVMSALEPEWQSLTADLDGAELHTINGQRFITGQLSGRDVVLFLSGVSMVAAGMTAQLALDRTDIDKIVFSRIAEGVDGVFMFLASKNSTTLVRAFLSALPE